jgi:CubicO group peptidase (beta-lactamase class C family)
MAGDGDARVFERRPTSSTASPSIIRGPFDGLTHLEAQMAEASAPAVSAASWTNDTLYRLTLGHSKAGGRLVDAHTVFQAGSVSKPVTAIGVLRLAALGVVDLDADVNEYLRSWKVPPVEGW